MCTAIQRQQNRPSLPGIWQLLLHEELLGALCRVEVALPGHTLHLLQLPSLGSSLNVPAASSHEHKLAGVQVVWPAWQLATAALKAASID